MSRYIGSGNTPLKPRGAHIPTAKCKQLSYLARPFPRDRISPRLLLAKIESNISCFIPSTIQSGFGLATGLQVIGATLQLLVARGSSHLAPGLPITLGPASPVGGYLHLAHVLGLLLQLPLLPPSSVLAFPLGQGTPMYSAATCLSSPIN